MLWKCYELLQISEVTNMPPNIQMIDKTLNNVMRFGKTRSSLKSSRFLIATDRSETVVALGQQIASLSTLPKLDYYF